MNKSVVIKIPANKLEEVGELVKAWFTTKPVGEFRAHVCDDDDFFGGQVLKFEGDEEVINPIMDQINEVLNPRLINSLEMKTDITKWKYELEGKKDPEIIELAEMLRDSLISDNPGSAAVVQELIDRIKYDPHI